MSGYIAKSAKLIYSSVAINQTNTAVTSNFAITAGGSRSIKIAIVTGAATATCTFKLQSSIDGSVWADHGSIAATGASTYIIENNIFDGTDAVLGPLGRIVVTTNGTGTATVSSILVAQED